MSHSGLHHTDDGERGRRAQDWERLIDLMIIHATNDQSLVVRYNCLSSICNFYDIHEMFYIIA